MEKYSNILKVEEIRRLAEIRQYKKALKILDTMDVDKVKVITDLSVFADIYTKNERYEEAMEILLRIYQKSKTRRVLFQLVNLSVRRQSFEEAEQYYNEYIVAAPKDSNRFILRYRMDKAKGMDYETLIHTLEELKEYDYIEEWAYELAKLYHKAGYKDKCVRECSDIILWFGEGTIVEKARLLKAHYVGASEHINIINVKEKQELEQQRLFEKTKNLSDAVEELNQMLDQEGDPEEIAHQIKEENARIEEEEKEQLEKKTLQAEEEKRVQPEAEEIQAEEEEKARTEEESAEPDKEALAEGSIPTEEAEAASEDWSNIQIDLSGLGIQEPEALDEIAVTAQLEPEDSADVVYQEGEESGQDKEISEMMKEPEELPSLLIRNIEVNGIFKAFLLVDGLQEQIFDTLNYMADNMGKSNNVVVTGGRKTGKTTLVKRLSKALYKLGYIKTPKIAMITAEKLNRINLMEKKDQLLNGCVVIGDAGKIQAGTAEQIISLCQEAGSHIVFILEDSKEEIARLFMKYSFFAACFGNQVDIPEFSASNLLAFAYNYLEEVEYCVNEEAKNVLKEIVCQIKQQVSKEEYLLTLRQVIDEAKERAEQRNMANLLDVVSHGNYEKADWSVLIADDFISE